MRHIIVQAHAILILRKRGSRNLEIVHVLQNLEIVHTCYAIPRLPAQSRHSENVQRNLEIAQIPRLRGTLIQCLAFGSTECGAQLHKRGRWVPGLWSEFCTVQVLWGGSAFQGFWLYTNTCKCIRTKRSVAMNKKETRQWHCIFFCHMGIDLGLMPTPNKLKTNWEHQYL